MNPDTCLLSSMSGAVADLLAHTLLDHLSGILCRKKQSLCSTNVSLNFCKSTVKCPGSEGLTASARWTMFLLGLSPGEALLAFPSHICLPVGSTLLLLVYDYARSQQSLSQGFTPLLCCISWSSPESQTTPAPPQHPKQFSHAQMNTVDGSFFLTHCRGRQNPRHLQSFLVVLLCTPSALLISSQFKYWYETSEQLSHAQTATIQICFPGLSVTVCSAWGSIRVFNSLIKSLPHTLVIIRVEA